MKKNILNLFTLVALGIALVGFKTKADKTMHNKNEIATSNTVAKEYTVNAESSVIEWQGFKPTGSHKGIINLKSGVITAKGRKLRSGSFIIDMNTIKESNNNSRLEGHLKSADFFDVTQFPTASFEITSLEEKDGNTMLSGNLTLKGVTNPVSFTVSLTQHDNELTLTSNVFTIDRSKWNVRYGSKSFFDDLKDKFINDDIELKISIKASKKS